MSYKRKIKKNSDIKKEQNSAQIDKKSKQSVFNFLLNFVFFCILCILSDNSSASAALLGGYELIVCIMIWKSAKDRKSKIKRYLDVWNLLVIIAAGILFRMKYEFFEIPEGLLTMSRDEIKALSISIAVALCVIIIIDKTVNMEFEIWMKLILICGLSFSMIGQTLLFNDFFPEEKYAGMEYHVSEKLINDRIFKSYLLSLELDESHGFMVSVGKEEFSEIDINDKYPVTVYEGILGIDYVKTNKKYIIE